MDGVTTFLATSPWTPALIQGAAGLLTLAAWRVALGGRGARCGRAATPLRGAGRSARGDDESGEAAREAAGEDAGVPGATAAGRVRSPGLPAPESAVPDVIVPTVQGPQQPRLIMSASEQMREFLAYMISEGYARQRGDTLGRTGKYTDAVWADAYLHWARTNHVAPMPETVFLTQLGKQPETLVRRSRDRLKCRTTGRVLKNEKGTPLRATHYTLFEPAPVAVAVPRAPAGRPSGRGPEDKRAAGVSAGATMKRRAA